MDTQVTALPNGRRRLPARRILQSRRRQNGKSRRHFQPPPPLPAHETESRTEPKTETQSRHLVHMPAEPSVLHSFTSSRFPGKQDIALLLVMRRWQEMAVASADRREQLVQMWRTAFVFRRQSLVTQALRVWRTQAAQRALSSGNQYERVQMQLAAMHCRQLTMRHALDRLLQERELKRREEFFRERSEYRLLDRCWQAWAVRVQRTERAAYTVERRQQISVLENALSVWRDQTYERHVGRIAEQRHRAQLLVQTLRVWRVQLAGQRFAQQKETSPVKHSLDRWRGAADEQRKRRALDAAAAEMRTNQQRAILAQWRNALHALAKRADEADAFYEQTLLFPVLEQLPVVAASAQQSKGTADRFYHFTCMLNALQRWRQHARMRRSGMQQSRALREWARRRDQQRRRVLLLAWHKMAVSRGRVNELRVSSWLASATDADVGPELDIGGPGLVDAQTMTSFQNDIPKCDRGISIQSDSLAEVGASTGVQPESLSDQLRNAGVQPDSLSVQLGNAGVQLDNLAIMPECREKNELEIRAQRAEETAERYRAMLEAAAESVAPVKPNGDADYTALQRQGDDADRAALYQHQQQQQQQQQQAVDEDIAAQTRRNNILRSVLDGWRMVAQTRAQQTKLADAFYQERVRPAALLPCRRAMSNWRQKSTTIRQLQMAADKVCWVRVAGQLLGALGARVRESKALAADADALGRAMLLLRVWSKLFDAASSRVAERSRRSIAPDEGPAQREEMDVILAQVDADELAVYFGAWREVAQDMRALQADVAERLPRRLQLLAFNAPDGQFSWEVVHMERLIRGALESWLRQLRARRTALPQISEVVDNQGIPADNQNQNMLANNHGDMDIAALQKSEKLVKQAAQRRVLHRMMVALRGRLLESQQLTQTLERVMRTMAERGRQVRAAQTTATDFLLQPKLKHWWSRYFVYSSRLDNADIQANGTLLRLCLLHWVAQIRQHRTPDRGRQLYTTAVAFRWEKQARRTLLAWMRASSDGRVRVRLAQRTQGGDREQQLEEAAELWAQARAKRQALRQISRVASVRALQRDISMRFATAWGNANIQRHALSTWRMRVSPSSSMFFSMVGS